VKSGKTVNRFGETRCLNLFYPEDGSSMFVYQITWRHNPEDSSLRLDLSNRHTALVPVRCQQISESVDVLTEYDGLHATLGSGGGGGAGTRGEGWGGQVRLKNF